MPRKQNPIREITPDDGHTPRAPICAYCRDFDRWAVFPIESDDGQVWFCADCYVKVKKVVGGDRLNLKMPIFYTSVTPVPEVDHSR